jgi:hypothetical protein
MREVRGQVDAAKAGAGPVPPLQESSLEDSMSTKETVDAMLSEASFLLFGCSYDVLDAVRQSKCISEACCKFSDVQLEAGDNLRKATKEAA